MAGYIYIIKLSHKHQVKHLPNNDEKGISNVRTGIKNTKLYANTKLCF